MKCPNCGKELLLDHVVKDDSNTNYYYVCMNKSCKQSGKSFKPTGEEQEQRIKPKQQSL